jgi:hypothetical protein
VVASARRCFAGFFKAYSAYTASCRGISSTQSGAPTHHVIEGAWENDRSCLALLSDRDQASLDCSLPQNSTGGNWRRELLIRGLHVPDDLDMRRWNAGMR